MRVLFSRSPCIMRQANSTRYKNFTRFLYFFFGEYALYIYCCYCDVMRFSFPFQRNRALHVQTLGAQYLIK